MVTMWLFYFRIMINIILLLFYMGARDGLGMTWMIYYFPEVRSKKYWHLGVFRKESSLNSANTGATLKDW